MRRWRAGFGAALIVGLTVARVGAQTRADTTTAIRRIDTRTEALRGSAPITVGRAPWYQPYAPVYGYNGRPLRRPGELERTVRYIGDPTASRTVRQARTLNTVGRTMSLVGVGAVLLSTVVGPEQLRRNPTFWLGIGFGYGGLGVDLLGHHRRRKAVDRYNRLVRAAH